MSPYRFGKWKCLVDTVNFLKKVPSGEAHICLLIHLQAKQVVRATISCHSAGNPNMDSFLIQLLNFIKGWCFSVKAFFSVKAC